MNKFIKIVIPTYLYFIHSWYNYAFKQLCDGMLSCMIEFGKIT